MSRRTKFEHAVLDVLHEHTLLLRALTRNLNSSSRLMESILAHTTNHALRTSEPRARNRFGPIARDLVDSIRPLPTHQVAVVPREANDPEAVAQRDWAKQQRQRKTRSTKKAR